jgi:hypothetical protein
VDESLAPFAAEHLCKFRKWINTALKNHSNALFIPVIVTFPINYYKDKRKAFRSLAIELQRHLKKQYRFTRASSMVRVIYSVNHHTHRKEYVLVISLSGDAVGDKGLGEFLKKAKRIWGKVSWARESLVGLHFRLKEPLIRRLKVSDGSHHQQVANLTCMLSGIASIPDGVTVLPKSAFGEVNGFVPKQRKPKEEAPIATSGAAPTFRY